MQLDVSCQKTCCELLLKIICLHWDLLCVHRAIQKALSGANSSLLPGPHRTWEAHRGTAVKVSLFSTPDWQLSMSLEGGHCAERGGHISSLMLGSW